VAAHVNLIMQFRVFSTMHDSVRRRWNHSNDQLVAGFDTHFRTNPYAYPKLSSFATTINAMSVTRISAPLLAGLVGLSCAAYYGVVAFMPSLLSGRVEGIPVSIVVALALFLLFFGVTLLYALTGSADTPAERSRR
jgi:hypothetical protein